MADTDDIVVEIEKDDAAKTAGATEVETHAADPVADLKAQYEELQASEEAARQAREAADRRAAAADIARQAAEREVESSRTEITETRISTVEQGLAAAQTEAGAAKAEYIAAQEAGDWKRAADAQERIAAAQARIVRLDEAKSDLEIAKAQPARTETRQTEQRAPVHTDPVEAFLAQRSPKTQEWLRAHPDEARALALGTDSRRAAKINAADNDAVAEGFQRDTPEYFAHVEKFLGMGSANGASSGKTPQRRSSAPVAPVNGSAGGASGGGDTVKLTQGEANAANDGTLVWNYDDPSPQKKFKKGDPIGNQEMARRKLAMQKEGRYDPMNFIQQ